MPKIRKETSNRRSTNDRAKRRKQVKESKRKTAKAAKKSVQWKSKTPKDPGIPNEFPYKDQILAEIAEQRRRAAEEKEKKKADKQRAVAKTRALARGEPWESDNDDEDKSESEDGGDEIDGKRKATSKDLNVGLESIVALTAKHVGNELKPRPMAAVEESEEEEDDVPVLVNRDLPNLKAVLERADVLLEVLDVRDPMAYRSKHVEELATQLGKKVLFVLNKIDTSPREAVAQWSTHLRTQHPTLIFRSATSFLPEAPVQVAPKAKKGKGKAPKVPTGDAVGADQVLTCLGHWAKAKEGAEPLTVAVVGVTNVGKSALINSLLKRSALPVYTLASSSRGPTTTDLPQEVEIEIDGKNILVIDTPGLSFAAEAADLEAAEVHRARDILLRSKGRIDRLKDPNPPISHIIARANAEDLMLLYSLPAFVGGDATSFLSGVARANHLVKKKGELDLTGAARIVLRDWSVGKLAHFTLPPSGKSKTSTEDTAKLESSAGIPAELYAKDDAVLAALPTRKERRRAGGLVKLAASTADTRQAHVEQEWAALRVAEDETNDEGDEQPEDDDDEVMDMDSEEEEEEQEEAQSDEDGEDEEDSEEEEREEEEDTPVPVPLSNKQKRKRAVEPQPERPPKKVAFAPAPSSKARGAVKSGSIKAAQQKKPAKTAAAAPVILKKASSFKTAAKPKAVEPAPSSKAEANSKTANKPAAKQALSKGGKEKDAATGGEEAYDFGKFF